MRQARRGQWQAEDVQSKEQTLERLRAAGFRIYMLIGEPMYAQGRKKAAWARLLAQAYMIRRRLLYSCTLGRLNPTEEKGSGTHILSREPKSKFSSAVHWRGCAVKTFHPITARCVNTTAFPYSVNFSSIGKAVLSKRAILQLAGKNCAFARHKRLNLV